jgi:hypothetical protein
MKLRATTTLSLALVVGAANVLAQQTHQNAERERTITHYAIWSLNLSRPQQLGIAIGHVFALPNHPFVLSHHGPDGDGIVTEAEVATGGFKTAVGLHRGAGMGSLAARIVALRTWATREACLGIAPSSGRNGAVQLGRAADEPLNA